jgi:hypothetical protein
VPEPAVLGDGLAGQQRRPEAEDAPDLGIQVGRTQVQVQPVLLTLTSGTRCSSTSIPAPLSGARLR